MENSWTRLRFGSTKIHKKNSQKGMNPISSPYDSNYPKYQLKTLLLEPENHWNSAFLWHFTPESKIPGQMC